MGIGMKGQGIDKILAQFRQVDGSSTRRADGTGFGIGHYPTALQEFAPKFIILMVCVNIHNHLHIVVRHNFYN